jgi:ribosomal protein S18 acetylase RimI-like enzyme
VAGLHGWTWSGWLKINYLWVSVEERGRGRGRQMLLMAEAEARKRGCSHATLSTYSFQAPDFYRRLGSVSPPPLKVVLKVIANTRC